MGWTGNHHFEHGWALPVGMLLASFGQFPKNKCEKKIIKLIRIPGWWESFVSESGMLRPVSSVTGYFYRLKRDMFEKDSRLQKIKHIDGLGSSCNDFLHIP